MNNTKRYNFLYRTTNLINNKIYIGVHSTDDVFDGYLGSGKHLKRAVKKYGNGQFHREVLRYTSTPEESYQLESIVVNDGYIRNQDNYNLCVGGYGGSKQTGWDHLKGKVAVRDNDGNTMSVKVDDPRYLSGELIPLSRGRIQKNRTPYKLVECPHCGKIGKEVAMNQWHFKHCKDNPNRAIPLRLRPKKCPHCGKIGTLNMNRYHFDNCKFK